MPALPRYGISESTEYLKDGPRNRCDHPRRRGRAFFILHYHHNAAPVSRHPSLASLPHSLTFSTFRPSRSRGTRPQAHHARRRENCNGNRHQIVRGGGFRVRERTQHTVILLTTTFLRHGERRGEERERRGGRSGANIAPSSRHIRPQTTSEGARISLMVLARHRRVLHSPMAAARSPTPLLHRNRRGS